MKESGKEFNTYQLRLKLFTTQKGTTTLQERDNTSRLVMSKEDMPVDTNRAPAESELKLSTKLVMFQLKDQFFKDNQPSDRQDLAVKELTFKALKELTLKVLKVLTLKAVNTLLDKPTLLAQFTLLDKPLTPLEDTQLAVKLSLQEEVESEERMFTDNLKPEVMPLEEVESDNDCCL